MTSILIVEDDITYGMMLKTWLGKKGFQVTSASNIARAQKHIESETVDLILSDLRLPDKDGIDLLKWLGEHGLQIPLIIMTGYADIQSAVQTMKLGACDYIAKPVNPDELLKKIGEALNASSSALKQMMHSSRTDDAFTPNRPSVSPKQTMHSDKMKNQPLKGAEGSLSSSDFLEGESDAAKQLYNYVKLVSPTNMSVLINGASGTGKEYVAHRIHQLSKRADQPFVAIDCGSIPKELAASEFFGHIKGAFTGAASAGKIGKIELANHGTLFLDEIGELPPHIQSKLLQLIQEKTIERVSGTKRIELDFRLLVATNRNLEEEVQRGLFRSDLFYRLNVIRVHIPPLRQRPEDILPMAHQFLERFCKEYGKQLALSPRFVAFLEQYPWPGNVRQLENLMERLVITAQNPILDITALPLEYNSGGSAPDLPSQEGTLAERMDAFEGQIIRDSYRRCGTTVAVAKELGISQATAVRKIAKYVKDRKE